MRRIFNGKAANAADAVVLKRHFNPHADAYLVLGRLPEPDGHFFAWESRHKKGFVDGVCFDTENEARKYFESMVRDPRYSDHPRIEKDWQADAVYEWEDESLAAFSQDLDEAGLKELTRRIARDYKIPPEDLVWGEWDEESGEAIDRGDSTDNISFLHEMAHHIQDYREDGDIPALHAPGFVVCAIELYHRYAGIDSDFLIRSAAAKNILGDADEIPHIIADIQTKKEHGDHVREFKRKEPEPPKASFG